MNYNRVFRHWKRFNVTTFFLSSTNIKFHIMGRGYLKPLIGHEVEEIIPHACGFFLQIHVLIGYYNE